jgi:aspartyl-tRNA(Asn)/glutamyl-tRNA(Gln) amidotransferase subunit B
MMGEVKSYLNEQGVDIQQFPIDAKRLADLIALIAEGTVSHSIAAQRIFPIMLKDSREALTIAKAEDLLQTSDHEAVQQFIEDVLASNAKEVERYRSGEKQLIGFFMGQFMKVSGGKVDPKTANQLLRSALEA